MDNVIWSTAVGLGIVAALFVIVFIWEVTRSAYFAVAAKWYGWSEGEKHERVMARQYRVWAREERQAKRDQTAAGNFERRRLGVFITTFAIAGLAFQMNLPWWNAGLIMVGAWVGLTMAVGLSMKWR